jgi:Astacin (Peptidase family M12A)
MTPLGSVPVVQTGRFSAGRFQHRLVTYTVVGDLAVVEGDIIIGRLAQIEAISALADMKAMMPEGARVKGDQFLWPQGRIPYYVDPALPQPGRVAEAIAHWEARTPIRFVALGGTNFNEHRDRVRFAPGSLCASTPGRRGGEQEVQLEGNCMVGHVIHEIGHVVGLWHEQSRTDRDEYVEILWENVDPKATSNFDQKLNDREVEDLGAYDYGSVMHYPGDAFSRNGKPTIRVKNGAKIGQRERLSEGDLTAVLQLYP